MTKRVGKSQRALPFTTHGGKRRNAGRKRAGNRAGVTHAKRPLLNRRHPVHVGVKVRRGIPSLRARGMANVVTLALAQADGRFGFHIRHFSVQRNHIHLLIEGDDRVALLRGTQGLAIRLAKAINRRLKLRGKVFSDRYWARVLKTPREIRAALSYVLNNSRKHAAQHGIRLPRTWLDPLSSAFRFDGWKDPPRAACDKVPLIDLTPPRGFLLASAWRRHGLIRCNETPKSI